MKIILASQNKWKLKEFIDIVKLNDKKIIFEIKPLSKDIGNILENGNSYQENALIKAQTVFNFYKEPVLADDSGIELIDFNYIPGIHSARFAGLNATEQENRNKLSNFLKEKNIKEARARFVCVLAFKQDKDSHYFFEGIWNGKVITNYTNQNSFGYDPMFIPDGYPCVVSELSNNEKNLISHRSNALKKLFEFIN